MNPLSFLALLIASAASSQLPSQGVSPEANGADAAVPEAWLERITEDLRREEYACSPLGAAVTCALMNMATDEGAAPRRRASAFPSKSK